MSAYICNPEHFGILAAYAASKRSVFHKFRRDDQVLTAQAVARALAAENIRSVSCRYPDDKDGQRPGPGMRDAEIMEAAAIYAGHFVSKGIIPTTLQVLKLCAGLEYQSCETHDYRQSDAYIQLYWIRSTAIQSLPGYEQECWSYDEPVPAIEALYSNSI